MLSNACVQTAIRSLGTVLSVCIHSVWNHPPVDFLRNIVTQQLNFSMSFEGDTFVKLTWKSMCLWSEYGHHVRKVISGKRNINFTSFHLPWRTQRNRKFELKGSLLPFVTSWHFYMWTWELRIHVYLIHFHITHCKQQSWVSLDIWVYPVSFFLKFSHTSVATEPLACYDWSRTAHLY